METMTKQDTLSIKQWADNKDKELREKIDFYISEGLTKEKAVEISLKSSSLGKGYHAQIRHDYNINPFINLT